MRLIILLVIAGALFSWMCIFCHWITDKHLGYSGPHSWCFSRFIFFFLPCLHCDYSWSSVYSPHMYAFMSILGAANLHVFPRQWKSCRDETGSRENNGCIITLAYGFSYLALFLDFLCPGPLLFIHLVSLFSQELAEDSSIGWCCYWTLIM